mmetsp:Transcript_12223/g.21708  ORF Transcript_12223/g.21708 Transcript_12223/m.21708 type:complete len:107 (-) Transcript_12223:183-503(-)|eukprot:CAMPEP_0197621256 /NCGR_PEP_ID=MMETSP1338-20131121/1866_1 /TAXON_ID=43686 ORGANISM="Pelagodinium beii, Strain RCC1491" /NCGR_SAMPLE_ID=MMETSP1338 /ASSEMBLY_ACC=CAM_ASM_000754 /LENGTH=106 /DNA_ID=CAMNT_0043190657 /DNA_START=87 /DNA_END=407 /DNA_ORIENTATION=+
MARASSPLLSVLCLVAAALLFSSPAFVPGSAVAPRTQVSQSDVLRLGAAAAFPAAFGGADMVLADEGLPTPVLGIGMLSVIVVIVLIVSGLVIARGLLDDEVGGEL